MLSAEGAIKARTHPLDERAVVVDGLLVAVDAHVGDGGARHVAARVHAALLRAQHLQRAPARLQHLRLRLHRHHLADLVQQQAQVLRAHTHTHTILTTEKC